MARTTEIERKYDADSGYLVPDLRGAGGCAGLGEAVTHELRACYFDTVDLRLAARRITLRQRSGGTDAGWHLKLPAVGDARVEIQFPPDDSAAAAGVPPPELAALVAGHARGLALVPVAELVTVRVERDVLGDRGQVLAKLADDSVTGRRLAGEDAGDAAGDALSWREIEVELVDGAQGLLQALGKRLRRNGAERATSSSKLSRVLGDSVPPPPPAVSHHTAGESVTAYLREQIAQLLAQDPLVRLADHDDDSVHAMRVAARRLRSVLRTHRPLLGPEDVLPLEAELRWLAAVLGDVRDLEVMRARFTSRLAELGLGSGGETLPGWLVALAAEEGAAREQLRGHLLSPRYFALLDTLDALTAHPPRTRRAGRKAATEEAAVVRETWRKMERVYLRAILLPPGEQRDTELHAARKVAKRARYTAEAAKQVLGETAVRAASSAKRLQEVLGTGQDGVIAQQHLRRLASAPDVSPADAFVLGRLAGLEQAEAARVMASLPLEALEDPFTS